LCMRISPRLSSSSCRKASLERSGELGRPLAFLRLLYAAPRLSVVHSPWPFDDSGPGPTPRLPHWPVVSSFSGCHCNLSQASEGRSLVRTDRREADVDRGCSLRDWNHGLSKNVGNSVSTIVERHRTLDCLSSRNISIDPCQEFVAARQNARSAMMKSCECDRARRHR
jgi:hypothetical protein